MVVNDPGKCNCSCHRSSRLVRHAAPCCCIHRKRFGHCEVCDGPRIESIDVEELIRLAASGSKNKSVRITVNENGSTDIKFVGPDGMVEWLARPSLGSALKCVLERQSELEIEHG